MGQCAVLYANIWLERRKNVAVAKQGVRSIGQKMATLYPGSASLSVGCKRRFIFWYSVKMLPSANIEKNRERGWRSSLRHFRSENCHWRRRIPCCFGEGGIRPYQGGHWKSLFISLQQFEEASIVCFPFTAKENILHQGFDKRLFLFGIIQKFLRDCFRRGCEFGLVCYHQKKVLHLLALLALKDWGQIQTLDYMCSCCQRRQLCV